MIAALFVETDGVYFGIPDVDPWDVKRDARLYAGPWPVVAHPPCERWGRFAKAEERRGGARVGDDGGCFEIALDRVRRFGGVLEHPAHSIAWDRFALPAPWRFGWRRDPHSARPAWVCEVEQGHYGHRARKATWLYFVGPYPPELIWGRSIPQPIPARSAFSAILRGVPISKVGAVAVMSRRQRAATPPAFRDLLLSMARSVAQERAA